MTNRILIIEDNIDISNLIRVNLSCRSRSIDTYSEGIEGMKAALTNNYDLIILDLMLPGVDGVVICRTLRRAKVYTPVLMLTARTSELDRVLGLEVGADDYLTKPFSIQELIARVNAILRRAEEYLKIESTQTMNHSITEGELRIDPERREVTIDETPIELTAKEFDLLWHFASNPGKVFSRNQLLNSVWGYHHAGYEHTVNSHINRLRSKLEKDPAKPDYVLTVWGVGYRFNDNLTGLESHV